MLFNQICFFRITIFFGCSHVRRRDCLSEQNEYKHVCMLLWGPIFQGDGRENVIRFSTHTEKSIFALLSKIRL